MDNEWNKNIVEHFSSQLHLCTLNSRWITITRKMMDSATTVTLTVIINRRKMGQNITVKTNTLGATGNIADDAVLYQIMFTLATGFAIRKDRVSVQSLSSRYVFS